MTTIAVAAGGAAWELELLPRIAAAPDLELVRRCVDLSDLLALAATGSVAVAVVDVAPGGIDLEAVRTLGRHDVTVVGVGPADRGAAVGVEHVATGADVLDVVRSAAAHRAGRRREPGPGDAREPIPRGRLVVVWGSGGAPGRSTLALALADALARPADRSVVLLDADVMGGSQAQALGLLDDVSGLAAACRAANRGDDEVDDHLVAVAPRLRLLTGIPAAHMWRQVRPAAVERVVDRLLAAADVVVADVAAPIEASESGGRGRHDVTRDLLGRADDVLVVGRADPVGLGRLVRAVHELVELDVRQPVVVLNRWRRSVGWPEDEVLQTVERLTGHRPAAVLPDDTSLLDAALVSGRLPSSVSSQSGLVTAMDGLAERLVTAVAV